MLNEELKQFSTDKINFKMNRFYGLIQYIPWKFALHPQICGMSGNVTHSWSCNTIHMVSLNFS